MKRRLLDRLRIRQVLTLLLMAGALTCLFPPQIAVFQWWAGHAIYIALGYFVAGLGFLVFGKIRLMFVCFGCSAAICLYQLEIGDRPPAATSTRSSGHGEPSYSFVAPPSGEPTPTYAY